MATHEKRWFTVAQYTKAGRLIGSTGGPEIDTEEKAVALADKLIEMSEPDFVFDLVIVEHYESVVSRPVGSWPRRRKS